MSSTDGPSSSAGDPLAAQGGLTAAFLRYLVLAALVVLGVVGGAGLTRPSGAGWACVILGAMGLWAGWLYWRTALGDRDVPAHLLHPFVAGVVAVLLVHLLRAGAAAGPGGRVELLGAADGNILMRLMTLTLLVLLAQDVLSRVRHLRWLLTGMGVFVAVGALLRLYASVAVTGSASVTLGGLAGVGMLLAPLLMPDGPAERVLPFLPDRLRRYGAVARVGAGALLTALLIVPHPGCALGGVIAAAAGGAALLLAGVAYPHYRLRLLIAGGILAVSAAAGVYRLKPPAPPWLGSVTVWGSGLVPADPGASGAGVLCASAGWVGAALLAGGVAVAVIRSLWAGRRSAAGDQARSALWAAVVLTAASALLAPGGMAVPSTTVIAAIALGLMPHVMVHRARRFHGLLVVCAFAVVLTVTGLQRTFSTSAWSILARRYGDGPLHLFGTFVLAGILFWQVGGGRFRWAAVSAVAAAAFAGVGEVAQRCLSTRTGEWSDVLWNCLGAAAALAVLASIRAAAWVEGLLAARPKVSTERYETWRHVSVAAAHPEEPSRPSRAPSPQFAPGDRQEGSDRQSRPARPR
ncbi:MAG: hypothetical protein ACYS5V_06620 [Planctomycetota bacterium]|jgi:hypothetical protein